MDNQISDKKPLHAAVIGSGFGGLAAAIRLATAGAKVTVFETRDKPGGRAYVYQDGPYTFDAVSGGDRFEHGRDISVFVSAHPKTQTTG